MVNHDTLKTPPISVYQEALNDKIDACWCINRDKQGIANVYKTAEYLYYSLYLQDQIEEDVQPVESFPGCIDAFVGTPPDIEFDHIPTKDEFMERIIRAMTREVDYESCLFEGALDTLEELTQQGEVTIWTAGDARGIPEAHLPGSNQQLHKLARAGLGNVRRTLASKQDRKINDVFRVIADEDKISRLLEELPHREVGNTFFVIDDQLKNLKKVVEGTVGTDIELIPIWVNKSNEDPEWCCRIDSITQLPNLLTTLGDDMKKVFYIDYDDVLSDDKKRSILYKEAIIHALEEQNWIRERHIG